jgi:hypothetical protein
MFIWGTEKEQLMWENDRCRAFVKQDLFRDHRYGMMDLGKR